MLGVVSERLAPSYCVYALSYGVPYAFTDLQQKLMKFLLQRILVIQGYEFRIESAFFQSYGSKLPPRPYSDHIEGNP